MYCYEISVKSVSEFSNLEDLVWALRAQETLVGTLLVNSNNVDTSQLGAVLFIYGFELSMLEYRTRKELSNEEFSSMFNAEDVDFDPVMLEQYRRSFYISTEPEATPTAWSALPVSYDPQYIHEVIVPDDNNYDEYLSEEEEAKWEAEQLERHQQILESNWARYED